MPYLAKEINVMVPDSDVALVTHPSVTLIEQSLMHPWCKCQNTPACSWQGKDPREHWRVTHHETYIPTTRVVKLQQIVPSPGIDAITGQLLTIQNILDRIAAL